MDAGVGGSGDILGAITSTAAADVYYISTEDDIVGAVTLASGNASEIVDVRSENLVADVSSRGSIYRIYASGDVGEWDYGSNPIVPIGTTPISIESLRDNSGSEDNIGYLLASNAFADVSSSVNSTYGGRIGRFRLAAGILPDGTTSTETSTEILADPQVFTASSYFVGSLTTQGVGNPTQGSEFRFPGINIVHFDADATIFNRPRRIAAIGNLEADRTFTIQNGLNTVPAPGEENLPVSQHTDPGLWITNDNGGLAGQVVINGAWNTAEDPEDYWVSPVYFGQDGAGGPPLWKIGPDETDPDYKAPRYLATAAELGGGHIGLPPFYWHPVESQTITSGTSVARVDMVFYGPVEELSPSNGIDSVVVERTAQDLPLCEWSTDPCSECSTSYSSFTAFTTSISGRTMQIIPDGGSFPAGYRYRVYFDVTPNSGTTETDLVCVGVGNGIVQVHGFAKADWPLNGCEENFQFIVYSSEGLRADLDGSEEVDFTDIVEWTANPIDFDLDNDVDSMDAQFIVNNYGPVD